MTDQLSKFSWIRQRLGLAAMFAIGLFAPWLYKAATLCLESREHHEITRQVSPDKVHDAVILAWPAGILSAGVVYEVRIGRHSFDSALMPPVLTAAHSSGLGLRWNGPHLLEVEYARAAIDQFTDHWAPCAKCLPTVEIRLILQPGNHAGRISAHAAGTITQ
jgi:hypothetical protein